MFSVSCQHFALVFFFFWSIKEYCLWEESGTSAPSAGWLILCQCSGSVKQYISFIVAWTDLCTPIMYHYFQRDRPVGLEFKALDEVLGNWYIVEVKEVAGLGNGL